MEGGGAEKMISSVRTPCALCLKSDFTIATGCVTQVSL
jgi:hypothetical protein